MKKNYVCTIACCRLLIVLCCFGLPELIYAAAQNEALAVERMPGMTVLNTDRPIVASDGPTNGPTNRHTITITGGRFSGVTIGPVTVPESEPRYRFGGGFESRMSETVQPPLRPENMSELTHRIDSLNQANVATHSAYTLGQCGFFSPDGSDRLQCFSCRVVLGSWKESDHILERHMRNCGQCNHLDVLCRTPAPINIAMQKCSARIRSCAALPASAFSDSRTAISFGMAGLYALGSGDKVKCFYCDGGLENWEPSDDPLDEHARWFPNCALVAQLKTPEEIQAILNRHNDNFIPFYKKCISAGPFLEGIYNLRVHSLTNRIASFQSQAAQWSQEIIKKLSLAGFSLSGNDSEKASCLKCDFSQRIDELLSFGPAESHQLQNFTDNPCPFVSQTMFLTENVPPSAQATAYQGEDVLQQAFALLVQQGYATGIVEEGINALDRNELLLPVDRLVAVLQARLSMRGEQEISLSDIASTFLGRGFSDEQINSAVSVLLDRTMPITHATVEQVLNANNTRRGGENMRSVDDLMARLGAAMGAAGAGFSQARNPIHNAQGGSGMTFRTRRNDSTPTVIIRNIMMRNGEFLQRQPAQFGTGFRGARTSTQPFNRIDSQNLTRVTGDNDPEACCICYSYKADHIYYPCGHLTVCGGCAARASENGCPTCRVGVEDIIKVHR
ncbi:hypothetical protein N9V90_00970 [Endozoicomonas sp.]|nr:hypothetical protein [Endozoicomonas sp.]